MKIVLAGGSGALGRRLAGAAAARGDEVVVLTRTVRPDVSHRQVRWDGETVGAWADELADAVLINLAGELVDRRPTPSNIALLTRSRVQPTAALAAAASGASVPPKVWVQLSTVAIYGDADEAMLDEDSPVGDGPPQMCDVARAWEAAAVGAPAQRQVILRTGVVLDRNTPALDRLTTIARWGLGGRIGNGQQWISWLHIDDFLAIVDRVIADANFSGVVHATSPNPVRNVELMRALRHAVHRPPAAPTPAWLVKLGAIALRTDPALALTGRRAIPGRLIAAGYQFLHPTLTDALTELLSSRSDRRNRAG
jgi:uncharacterized protein (TIGR01777 family)